MLGLKEHHYWFLLSLTLFVVAILEKRIRLLILFGGAVFFVALYQWIEYEYKQTKKVKRK